MFNKVQSAYQGVKQDFTSSATGGAATASIDSATNEGVADSNTNGSDFLAQYGAIMSGQAHDAMEQAKMNATLTRAESVSHAITARAEAQAKTSNAGADAGKAAA